MPGMDIKQLESCNSNHWKCLVCSRTMSLKLGCLNGHALCTNFVGKYGRSSIERKDLKCVCLSVCLSVCLVWSGPSVPIEFPCTCISVNPRNCTYEFPRRYISVSPRKCSSSVKSTNIFYACIQ
jgi:hypothetical protein